MSARRLPIGLIAPIALVVLITALGFLQYRWVGQVSERERDQLRQSLERRAREFAAEFDREIGRAYELFAPEPGFQPTDPERFAKRHDEWQTASPFAGLVKTAYYAQAQGRDDFALFQYVPATRAFEPVEWPAVLMPARARLNLAHARTPAQIPGGANVIAFTGSPVLPSIPAILIPEQAAPVRARAPDQPSPATASERAMLEMMVKVRAGGNHVVLELDREFLAGQLLPTLTARHFPETGSDSVRVAVVSGRSDDVFSRGLRAGQTLDLKTADASATFFGLRMEMVRTATIGAPVAAWAAVGERTRSGVATPAPVIRVTPSPAPGGISKPDAGARAGQQQFSMVIEQSAAAFSGAEVRVPAGWTLLLQHQAGSLDAAVAQVRRRNLFMSFGILGVLAASAGLVMVNARRSEKLAAQQMDFVATVSHELRTPLAVIRSAAQNLSAGVVHDASQAKRYGNLIEAEGRRLTDMVEQVLEYAGLSDARRRPAAQPADAGAIVRDVVAATASIDDATDVTFDVRIDPDLPPILADEDAIRRALHNLIGNAIKYGRDGRWVGVSVARGRGPQDGFVVMSVADHGRGIPADELSHIFEPFYRGRHAIDQQIRGNGLGLSLVKRIVEAHGGRVTVQSSPEQGSTFTLQVPVATGAATEAAVDVDASAGLTNATADRGSQSV